MYVGLVLPGNIWFAPYVRIYTRILDAEKVKYAIVSWNRDGGDEQEGFQYQERQGGGSAGFVAYLRYIRFVKRVVRSEAFDRLIVFGPQMTCLLNLFLLKYKDKFVIDYRDLSIEQRVGFKHVYAFFLRKSFANVISSPGFKRVLPNRDYLISHNFDSDRVRQLLGKTSESSFNTSNGIDVLTIGGIRDYSSNIEIVKSLANKDGVKCRFVGKGIASDRIESFCRDNSINNVSFHGYYPKSQEPEFIKECTFLNIFYPRVITHDTAMSNRFYNSLLYKRPMIVTRGTTQGEYAEKNGVGLAIDNGDALEERLVEFTQKDFQEYSDKCDDLLNSFLKDEDLFVESIKRFVRF